MSEIEEFGPVLAGSTALPRMPLTELCALLARLKQRRNEAFRSAVLDLVKGGSLSPDKAAGIMAFESQYELPLEAAQEYAATPVGTLEILQWATKVSGERMESLESVPKYRLAAAAVAILHLGVPDPTPAASGARSGASPRSPTSSSSPENPALTRAAIPTPS
jgi:hypothetical protein